MSHGRLYDLANKVRLLQSTRREPIPAVAPCSESIHATWGVHLGAGWRRTDQRYPRGMVKVARLLDALRSLAWRHGVVSGPGVTHEVQPNGDHVITIVVPKLIAEWNEGPKGDAKATYPSAGWTPRKD
jgi:hypothetical protein